MLTSSLDKNVARTVMGGEEGPICDPRSELLLGGSARVVRGPRIINGMKKTKQTKTKQEKRGFVAAWELGSYQHMVY